MKLVAVMAVAMATWAAPAGAAWTPVASPGRLVEVRPGVAGLLGASSADPLRVLDGAVPRATSPIAPTPGCTVAAFDVQRVLRECEGEVLHVTRYDGAVLARLPDPVYDDRHASAVGSHLVELYDATYHVEQYAYVDWRTGREIDSPNRSRLDLDRASSAPVTSPCTLKHPPRYAIARRDFTPFARRCTSRTLLPLPGAAKGRAPLRRSAFLIEYPVATVARDRALWITSDGRLATRTLPRGPVRVLDLPDDANRPTAMTASATHLYVEISGRVHAAPLP